MFKENDLLLYSGMCVVLRFTAIQIYIENSINHSVMCGILRKDSWLLVLRWNRSTLRISTLVNIN